MFNVELPYQEFCVTPVGSIANNALSMPLQDKIPLMVFKDDVKKGTELLRKLTKPDSKKKIAQNDEKNA